jgi:hypothetical protein
MSTEHYELVISLLGPPCINTYTNGHGCEKLLNDSSPLAFCTYVFIVLSENLSLLMYTFVENLHFTHVFIDLNVSFEITIFLIYMYVSHRLTKTTVCTFLRLTMSLIHINLLTHHPFKWS